MTSRRKLNDSGMRNLWVVTFVVNLSEFGPDTDRSDEPYDWSGPKVRELDGTKCTMGLSACTAETFLGALWEGSPFNSFHVTSQVHSLTSSTPMIRFV